MSGKNKHKARSHRSHSKDIANLQWFYRYSDSKQQIKIKQDEYRKSWMNRFLEMIRDEHADSEEEVAVENG